MDTSGRVPYQLDTSIDAITIDECEFNGNTAFSNSADSEIMSNGLTIVSRRPVNIEIKNSYFVGNNSAWNHDGVLSIQASEVTSDDYQGITKGSNCPEITASGIVRREGTCWINEFYPENRQDIYFVSGFYLKLTSNIFDSN